MIALIKTVGHYIVGLAVIGAVSGLAAVGTITGGQAIAVIVGVGSILIGAGITTSATPTPPKGP